MGNIIKMSSLCYLMNTQSYEDTRNARNSNVNYNESISAAYVQNVWYPVRKEQPSNLLENEHESKIIGQAYKQ